MVYATNRFDDELTDLIKIVRNDEEDEVDDDEDILQDAFLAWEICQNIYDNIVFILCDMCICKKKYSYSVDYWYTHLLH